MIVKKKLKTQINIILTTVKGSFEVVTNTMQPFVCIDMEGTREEPNKPIISTNTLILLFTVVVKQSN